MRQPVVRVPVLSRPTVEHVVSVSNTDDFLIRIRLREAGSKTEELAPMQSSSGEVSGEKNIVWQQPYYWYGIWWSSMASSYLVKHGIATP